MKKKVYLRYMSNTNNQYIYDDASGNIFQWNNLYEEIITCIKRNEGYYV